MGAFLSAALRKGRSQAALPALAAAAALGAAAAGMALVVFARGGAMRFAQLPVSKDKVFYASPQGSSMALQGIRPVLPGHLLVVPRRPAARLHELSREEVADLFATARAAQELARAAHGATAFNWALKDGPAAGPPVPHLHVHVVPRRPGDLKVNDLVYELIDRWSPLEGQDNAPPALDLPPDDQRRARSDDDMAREAARYAERRAEARRRRGGGGVTGVLPGEEVRFGKFKLKPSQVFYASASGLTLATVNLKPLVPGHVLVIPRRVVPTVAELTQEELDDLFASVLEVQTLVQDCHGATASNLGLQDGRDAGQSVPHVHVHVLPLGQGGQDGQGGQAGQGGQGGPGGPGGGPGAGEGRGAKSSL